MIEDLTTRIVIFVTASGLMGWCIYEAFFNHRDWKYVKPDGTPLKDLEK